MNTKAFPDAALAQHVAILGKTGSGKTSSEKLAVEQVVADGFRVCILDAVKSDWWGITSSADGKKPGLPFKILGGPHGHVPLHSSAGAVIGSLVGSGKLPLSIIDMADFEAGGLQRFFVDFAPALMRSMRGVLYLVVEEAHEFAPKERSGIGAENMAIHWAKKLATAGRSKGIRMIVATQRVQSLHNAVLGSCETLIAHRLSAPSDQEPILKWLKANADKETAEEVAQSLSSLPTGTGWLCSGEAKIFERVAFPKFKTFDNAATPTRDGPEICVTTAPVDQDELRAIIGDAVAVAEENDPKRLRARIAELEKGRNDTDAIRKAEEVGYARGRLDGREEAGTALRAEVDGLAGISDRLGDLLSTLTVGGETVGEPRRQAPILKAPSPAIEAAISGRNVSSGSSSDVTAPQQRILDALAKLESLGVSRMTKGQAAAFAGASPKSSAFMSNVSQLRTIGLIDYPRPGELSLTKEGQGAASYPNTPPTVADLQAAWLRLMSATQARILEAAIKAWPHSLEKSVLAERAGASPSSSAFMSNVSALRSLGVLDYPVQGHVIATDFLFPARTA